VPGAGPVATCVDVVEPVVSELKGGANLRVVVGSVADWPMCTCYDDAARGSGCTRKATSMKTSRIIAGALLAASLAAAGMGPGAGAAQAGNGDLR
jgi:hypothetical protein